MWILCGEEGASALVWGAQNALRVHFTKSASSTQFADTFSKFDGIKTLNPSEAVDTIIPLI